jgi:hypothetical protein
MCSGVFLLMLLAITTTATAIELNQEQEIDMSFQHDPEYKDLGFMEKIKYGIDKNIQI